jgi:hypothetical protein
MEKDLKDILLKDLCARLPYGVKMNHIADDEHSPKTLIGVAKDMITLEGLGGYESVDVEDYKPYLFPLSSMTKEQESYLHFNTKFRLDICNDLTVKNDEDDNYFYTDIYDYISLIDWLNKNHFDFRGLIEKGLAIDATGLNIY